MAVFRPTPPASLSGAHHCIYGYPEVAKHSETWDLLWSLKSRDKVSQLVVGNFNEIFPLDEKRGGRLRPEKQIVDFHQVLTNCDLRDLGFIRPPFTQSNRREGEALINERLDRCCANSQYYKFHLNCKVTHDSATYSDHLPIWLLSSQEKSPPRGP